MIDPRNTKRFNTVIGEIIDRTSIVSLLAASAEVWPLWKCRIGKLLVDHEVNLTLALQWRDQSRDALRMLRDVVSEFDAMAETPGFDVVEFPNVKDAIVVYCHTHGAGDTQEAVAFTQLAIAF